jgi:phosphoribosylanthranilate isomerase
MWVKICGIRNVEAAAVAAAAGADAIGLNFFAESPRFVGRRTAAEIVESLPDLVLPVGVFVNHSTNEIVETVRECGLRAVQLHGDEPPALVAELREVLPRVELILACRWSEVPEDLARFTGECQSNAARPDACLVEARVDGLYGGTGRTLPWEHLAGCWRAEWPRLILAGGLTCGNVGQAIRTVCPWGVDVAGGVEAAPGAKDPHLIRQFVTAARSADTASSA